jgi:hypothetical protein
MSVVSVVTNCYPGSSLAAAATCYSGGFHVKWDTFIIAAFIVYGWLNLVFHRLGVLEHKVPSV